MALGPNWKRHLKLSLVSCSALYLATTIDERIRLTSSTARPATECVTISWTPRPPTSSSNRKTASRAISSRKIKYVLVEEDELDNVALESTHTIESAGGDRRRLATSRRKSGMRAKHAPPRKMVSRAS